MTVVVALLVGACGSRQPAAAESKVVVAPSGEQSEPEPAARVASNPMLDEHNRNRAAHCAPALTWSAELEAVAQKWANHLRDSGCKFEHSGGKYGENLAAGTTGALPPSKVVAMWYDEVAKYNFARGGFSGQTGHFTQLVWIDTQRVGCGMVQCKGMDLWVCNYDPPGNVQGEYQKNVKPKGCK
jgi:uncharacterized protein YkwD